jgi:outer membrane protein OmpA-like peptidoglycan-associated protein
VRTDSGAFDNIDFGSELTYGVGAEVRVAEPVSIGLELFGSTMVENFFAEKAESPLEAVLGVKGRFLRGLHVELGAGTGLMPGYGSPEVRFFIGAQWAPWSGEPDTDGDGILDSKDKCPLDPEDKDGFEDEDGCPDKDNDNDGVLDDADRCRDIPEDIDDFEDDDGCPDEDNDKDGFKDHEDSCPDAPEDRDSYKDDDGCPDPDNDQDGVLDPDDKCIDVPETRNGYQDDDGCPDEPPLARIENCKIVIGEKVYFDTNRSKIKAVSFPLLNEVGRIIRENQGIDRVDIEGHTDSDGGAAYNRRLSDQRAKSVRQYLIGQGIAAKKLTGKGFGEDNPIADNSTAEGKEQNRRVEFIVRDSSCN